MRILNNETMITENSPLPEPDPCLILVDDDPDDLEIVADVYAGLNVTNKVKLLNSGEALMEFLEACDQDSQLPSLIVLDYNMPRLSGSTLLMLLKKDQRFKRIPVAVYSTNLLPDIEKQLIEDGAMFCRKKPTTEAQVRQLLIEFLSLADIFHESMIGNRESGTVRQGG